VQNVDMIQASAARTGGHAPKQAEEPHVIVNQSAPAATVVPILIYADVGKAIDWLCGAFGFAERLRVERDGIVSHAQLVVADGAIMLGRQGGQYLAPRHGEVHQYVHVSVEDVDRHFDQAKRFGARIVGPPNDTPFGERQYTAEDLEGHRWAFSQHVADVAPQQWGAKLAVE
jgi:uncharacterized glyoxalase superfamily protein PhnB